LQRSFKSLLAAGIILAVVPAGARAHTFDASIGCGAVTLRWDAFAAGGGGGALNAPEWTVSAAPNRTPIASGRASFSGTSASVAGSLPPVNGDYTAASHWSATQTRDGVTGGGSVSASVVDCTALSSSALAAAPLDGEIFDVAHLHGVTADAAGTITFSL
jgi:hypothetical protein